MAIDKNITYDDPVVQGGVDNYLGKQPQVQAPRKWQSAPDKPATELAYITEAEKDLILKANIHGGLEGGPNMGPSGIMSLDSFGDIGGAGASGGDTSAGGGAMEGRGFSGRNTNTTSEREFDRQKANQRAALQIAERAQAKALGEKERRNIATRTYGPLQKYTGERGFLGNLFRGANKYGYTDTYTSGPNEGEVKPGYGGRILGGILGLLTGIPFAGSIIGNQIDKFKPKPKDMSEFNKLGLGGIKPGTLDFDPNAQINQTIDPAVLQGLSRFSNKSLGLQTPKTFSDPFRNTVGTTANTTNDAVSSNSIPTVNGVPMIDTGSVYQDNLDFFDNLNKGLVVNNEPPMVNTDNVMQGSVLDAQPKKGIMQMISDAIFSPAGAAEITPAIGMENTGLGFSVPTGDVGLNASGRLGSLSATVDAIEALKGESVNPQINYSGQFGNTNVFGNYSDDVQNLGLNFNNDKGLSGGISYDAITGEPRFDIGFRRTFADGGLASMFTRRG